MQLVYHIGAHCTDEGLLMKCLQKNRKRLAEEGIVVPEPARARPVLRESMISLRGKPAPRELQETMLDAMMDEDGARRLIFSNESFICMPAKVLQEHMLYPMAGEKATWLAQLFPEAGCEFHLAIRNPATFVPALFARSNEKSFEGFIAGADPGRLAWSDVVRRIRNANPDAEFTVWCNEDTPLVWRDVLRSLSGHGPETELEGADALLATIMTEGGLKRMRAYLASNPPKTELQRSRVVAAFLDKFAIPEALEMELDVPGWTEDLVEDLTEAYEEDIFAIERMDGVNFIAP
ncbi:hypothetical protein Ga0609869_001810 [Rhodovulum iodosum]|uniref:DUF1835 domain-containing protein n=1 Tax=Rhodovulum iodosum TaxID=68291 RepID=A0ABV3XVP3_9RHOB|nr:hypothetical protein [Rhodovulum robiginosum]RSK39041.1 hypothetical protein EJA01_01520 [Rhodovulum robiginosum]